MKINYFPHDVNASNDSKIIKLKFKYSHQGYGIYWELIELLYQNDNYIELNLKELSHKLRVKSKILEDILKNFELFDNNSEFFWSNSIKNRVNQMNEKSLKASMSASYRWDKDANALRGENSRNAIKESKVKEIKEKETKVNDKEDLVIVNEIMGFFNKVNKSTYRCGENYIKLIRARLNEGFDIEDFKLVILTMHKKWIGTTQQDYLRPQTIFSNKFEGYLESAKKPIITQQNGTNTSNSDDPRNQRIGRTTVGEIHDFINRPYTGGEF